MCFSECVIATCCISNFDPCSIGDPNRHGLSYFYYGTCHISQAPNFWTDQPEVWFAQVEAQFSLRRITLNEAKYSHILSALDQDTATRLLDLISSPLTDDKYLVLKVCLTEIFSLSEHERAT